MANRLAPSIGGMDKTRRIMAYLGFAGASMFLVLSTRMNDPLMATLSIGMASFCNDLVMPGAWAACMNVGGKHAGSLSGTMNMTGNIAGAIAPQVIGFILYFTQPELESDLLSLGGDLSDGHCVLDVPGPLDAARRRNTRARVGQTSKARARRAGTNCRRRLRTNYRYR